VKPVDNVEFANYSALFDHLPWTLQFALRIRERVMSFDYNTRVRTGIILIMALALLSNVRLLLDWIEFDFSFVGHDDISRFDTKFEGVKAKLPPNGIIGFRSDSPDDIGLYYRTQYTLAPLVVSKLPAQRWVISLRSGDLNASSEYSGQDFTVTNPGKDFRMFDYHNGVRLIRSDDPSVEYDESESDNQ
jgi:hypothetical protein